jgi:putative heme iron utilization protein
MKPSSTIQSMDAICKEALLFHESKASLLLGTSYQDQPVASYAPYVVGDHGQFYIYLSELAAHTENLTLNPKASLLFIEDESEADHLFARRRMTYSCLSVPVERGSNEFVSVLDHYEKVHGAFIKMLRSLEDFRLFRLEPYHANYVRGFAQAYELVGSGLTEIRHIQDKGHRPGNDQSAHMLNVLTQSS